MEAEAEKDGKKAAEDTAPKSAKEVAEELKNRMEEARWKPSRTAAGFWNWKHRLKQAARRWNPFPTILRS